MARTLPIRLRTIAAAIVVIASGLIIWNAYQSIIGSTDMTDATLPIIKADGEPFRVVPENPGGAEIPHQGSTLYNVLNADNADAMALDGVNIPADDEEPETLIGNDSQPTTGFELPELPQKRTESLYGILGELEQDVSPAEVTPTPSQEEDENLDPTKADATIALKEKLKAAIEKVEEEQPAETEPTASEPELTEEKVEAEAVDVAEQPAVDVITIKPTRKPAYTKPTASVTKTPTPTPTTTPTTQDPVRPVVTETMPKRYYIQLASLRDEAQASAAYNTIRADFPNLVEGLSVSFPKADLGARGTFTRIQIGPLDSEREARDRCASYNATRGATCLVLSR